MASSPVLLLLLALGLCCSEIHGQRDRLMVKFCDTGTINPQEGQKLEMECQTPKEDSGAYWLLQDKWGTLHFIAFISSVLRVTYEGNQQSSPRFDARKRGSSYQLEVKSFKPQDEGKYFCLMNHNQELYFSPSLSAFLP
ncbi:CD8A protein, partial [Galbula dea]|nr:CD8A protein [Galbula dea]